MQTYQSTPDFYREYIEHGWLKDQAAKVHKYIKRWKNKAGKWVYQYTNPNANKPTMRSSELSKGIKSLSDTEGSLARYHINKDRGNPTRFSRQNTARNYARKKLANMSYSSRGNLRDRGYSSAEGNRIATGYRVYNNSQRRWATSNEAYTAKTKGTKNSPYTYKESTVIYDNRSTNKNLSNRKRGRSNREYIQNNSALLKDRIDKNGNTYTSRESYGARKRRIRRIYDDDRLLRSKGWTFKNGIPVPPTKNAMSNDPRYKKKKKR